MRIENSVDSNLISYISQVVLDQSHESTLIIVQGKGSEAVLNAVNSLPIAKPIRSYREMGKLMARKQWKEKIPLVTIAIPKDRWFSNTEACSIIRHFTYEQYQIGIKTILIAGEKVPKQLCEWASIHIRLTKWGYLISAARKMPNSHFAILPEELYYEEQ